jgi:transketolase
MIDTIKQLALTMRKDALEVAYKAKGKSTHFGSAMSIVDIVATLYGGILNINPKNPLDEKRDRFILSKGHGVLGYYTALANKGFFQKDELFTFECSKSSLMGHPIKCREKGIEFTNGSLGMGLSLGIGVAIALKKKTLNNKVYVLVGDGECNEGSIWEGAMSATHFKLDNLVLIVDNNKYQLGGLNSDIMNNIDLKAKFEAFGWETKEINGHNIEEIYSTLKEQNPTNKPVAIIANTIKGKGFSFCENNNAWHHAPLTEKFYQEALKEL